MYDASVHYIQASLLSTIERNHEMRMTITNHTTLDNSFWIIIKKGFARNTMKIVIYSVLFLIASIGNTTSFIALRYAVYFYFTLILNFILQLFLNKKAYE